MISPCSVYFCPHGRRVFTGQERTRRDWQGKKCLPPWQPLTWLKIILEGQTDRNSPQKVPQIQAGGEITRSEMRTRYWWKGPMKREEERLVLELYVLGPVLEKAVPCDRQNKQTKSEKRRNMGKKADMFLRLQLGPFKASLKCLTFK